MLINPEQLSTIYWYSAIVGTVVFALKTSLPIDSGTEVSGDFATSTDTDSSFNLFTLESISAFFMTSGWIGYLAFDKLHYELKISVAISLLTGILAMFFFTWLISRFRKLEHVPKADLKELLNKTGKAYMHFPPNGNGKIQIEFMSKLETLDAKNNTDCEIATFENIKVVKIENEQIFIEKA